MVTIHQGLETFENSNVDLQVFIFLSPSVYISIRKAVNLDFCFEVWLDNGLIDFKDNELSSFPGI